MTTEWLKTEISPLTVLEIRVRNAGVTLPLKSLGRKLSWPLPVSGGLGCLLACGSIFASVFPLPPSPCVSLYLLTRTPVIGVRAHPNPVRDPISAGYSCKDYFQIRSRSGSWWTWILGGHFTLLEWAMRTITLMEGSVVGHACPRKLWAWLSSTARYSADALGTDGNASLRHLCVGRFKRRKCTVINHAKEENVVLFYFLWTIQCFLHELLSRWEGEKQKTKLNSVHCRSAQCEPKI